MGLFILLLLIIIGIVAIIFIRNNIVRHHNANYSRLVRCDQLRTSKN